MANSLDSEHKREFNVKWREMLQEAAEIRLGLSANPRFDTQLNNFLKDEASEYGLTQAHFARELSGYLRQGKEYIENQRDELAALKTKLEGHTVKRETLEARQVQEKVNKVMAGIPASPELGIRPDKNPLQNDLNAANEKIKKLEDDNQALKDEKDALKQERDDLTKANQALKDEKDALQQEKDDLTKDKQALEAEKTALQQEKDDLTKDKQALKDEKDKLSRSKDLTETQNRDLEAQIRGFVTQIDQLKRDLESRTTAVDEKDNEITRIEKLKEEQLAKINELKEEIRQLQDKSSHSTEEISQIKQKLEQVTQELLEKDDELKSKEAELVTSKSEIAGLNDKLRGLEAKLKQAEEANSESKQDLEQQIRDTHAMLQKANEDLERAVSALDTQRENMRIAFEKKLQDITAERDELRFHYSDEQKRSQRFEREAAELSERVKTLEREKNELLEKLRKDKEEYNKLSFQYENLEIERIGIGERVKDLSEQNATLKAKLDRLEAKIREQEAEIRKQEGDIEEQNRMIRDITRENMELERSLKAAKETISKYELEIDRLKRQIVPPKPQPPTGPPSGVNEGFIEEKPQQFGVGAEIIANRIYEALKDKMPADWKFNTYWHSKCWKHFNVRPPVGDPNPERTDTKYCMYDPSKKSYSYNDAWIKLLIDTIQNKKELYEEIKKKKYTK